MKKTIIIGLILLMSIVVGCSKEELEYMGSEEVKLFGFNSTINCDNFSITGVDFRLELDDTQDYEIAKRPDFIRGYLLGFLMDNRTQKWGDYLYHVSLSVPECNINESKTYYKVSDLPTEDDCVEDNICFFKIDISLAQLQNTVMLPEEITRKLGENVTATHYGDKIIYCNVEECMTLYR